MLGRHKDNLILRAAIVLAATGLMILMATSGQGAKADTLTSPDYQLSPAVGDSFGGSFGSSNYALTDSGGEAAIGNGSGGSYKLGSGFVSELQHSINLYVEPAGLVAYYPMNEGAGDTVHDASGNSNDGTFSGSPTWAQGQIGDALNFNGSTDYVNLGSELPAIGQPGLTVSAWINPTTLGSSTYAVVSRDGPFVLWINGANKQVNTGLKDPSGSWHWYASPSNTITTGAWQQVVITYDGTTTAIYINGRLSGSTTQLSGNIQSVSNNPTDIGYDTTHGYYFSGYIDDVKIYDRALSADEVEANYEAGLNGFNSGLVIPPLQAGKSQTVDADVIVEADAPYSLLTQENGPLTDVNNPSNTIPSISGSIASPIAWSEGTTKGLGFTILSGPSGSGWGNGGADYAAVPAIATSFYSRSGLSGGAKDVIGLQYRLDVAATQPSGQYQNNIAYTATITP